MTPIADRHYGTRPGNDGADRVPGLVSSPWRRTTHLGSALALTALTALQLRIDRVGVARPGQCLALESPQTLMDSQPLMGPSMQAGVHFRAKTYHSHRPPPP